MAPAVIAPVADFSAEPRDGTAPLSVSFTDLSTNEPTSWDWEFEGVGQIGDRGPLDHASFAIHGEAGYTFADTMWTPRVALGYDFSPGDDDPTDGDNETFDNLFPTNHIHYGQMKRCIKY